MKLAGNDAISKFDWENQTFYFSRCGVQVRSCLTCFTLRELFSLLFPQGESFSGENYFIPNSIRETPA